jgi:hypothetical protein
LLGGEQQIVVARLPFAAERPERARQLLAQRDAPLLAALRQPDPAAVVAPLDVQALLSEVEVAEARLDRLAEAQAALGQEDAP